MDDDEKADIARRGLGLIERAEQTSVEGLKEAALEGARERAQRAVLGGVRAVAELTGTAPKRPRVGPSAEAIEHTLARMEAESTAAFDAELRASVGAARAREEERERDVEAAEAAALATLRRSFPAESKELALLLFACVDVLEDLAEIDDPPSAAELARKEALLSRIGELLAPRAEPALRSFVDHVVSLSRARRGPAR
ncbi:MAG: hypothetical protein K1X94_29015 [Sandaracinaceae bacterium]|nr:hypothetical protein [Sandaracinaceae bacterium]